MTASASGAEKTWGDLEGKIAADFDEPLDDFAAYMPTDGDKDAEADESQQPSS